MEILFVGVLGVVADGGVEDGDEVVFVFVGGVVADYVEAFEVVGEEDFEVGVVGVVEGGVDVVVVRAGVGGVFDFEVLDEYEVFDDLYVFDFPVFGEELADDYFTRFKHAADVELANEDALMDPLWRLCLLG